MEFAGHGAGKGLHCGSIEFYEVYVTVTKYAYECEPKCGKDGKFSYELKGPREVFGGTSRVRYQRIKRCWRFGLPGKGPDLPKA